MDFVTHAAVGALVGRVAAPTGADPRLARRYALAGALVAAVPDVDHVLEWFSAEGYLLYHRTATHSLLVSAAAVGLTGLLAPPPRMRRTLLVGLALASHLLLDVLTPFGTALAWPFSDERYAWDVLPLVCPWLTGISVLAAVFGAFRAQPRGRRPRRAAFTGLAILGAFVAMEVVVRGAGVCGLDPISPGVAGSSSRATTLVVPHWRWPLESMAVRHEGDEIVVRLLDASGAVRSSHTHPWIRHAGVAATPDVVAEVEAVARRPEVARMLRLLRMPTADVDAQEISFSDAQFEAIDEGLRPILVVVPRSGGEPRVVQTLLGTQPILYLVVAVLAYLLSRRPSRWP